MSEDTRPPKAAATSESGSGEKRPKKGVKKAGARTPPRSQGTAERSKGSPKPADTAAPAAKAPGKSSTGKASKRKTSAKPAAKISLPSSGLAHEILAQLESGGGRTAAEEAPALPPVPESVDRLYRFADGLEGQQPKAAEAVERPETWVSFALGEEDFALPVSHVREVVRVETLTRVPHAPFPVRGITTLRGQIVTVVDLRQRLGLPPVEITPESRILVTSSRGRTLGLLVDRAWHVVRIYPSRVQAPPEDVMSDQSEYLAGVVHQADGLVILLDLDQVLLIREGAGL